MTSQVILKTDTKLKQKAIKKARDKGIPLTYFLNMAMEAFANGWLSPELVERPQLNDKTKKILSQIDRDIKNGKNLSPTFKNAKEALRWLNKQ